MPLRLKNLNLNTNPAVLSWAPHPKALPHAVGNSFTQMMKHMDADFIIAHPEGYALNPIITEGIECMTDQEKPLKELTLFIPKIGVHMIITDKYSKQMING